MYPGADQQFALTRFWRAALSAHNPEVFDGILQEDVVPAADIECGSRHLLMFAGNSHRINQLTVHRGGDGQEKVWGHIVTHKRLKLFERQRMISLCSQRVDVLNKLIHGRSEGAWICTMAAHEDVNAH